MAENGVREPDFDYIALQHSHGGKYVVRRGNEVFVSADTPDELHRKSKMIPIDWDTVVTQYVDRLDEFLVHGLRITLQGDFARPAVSSSDPGDDTNSYRDE